MRILFVNYEYPPVGGGGGIVNAWLAEELARRHEVTVLTSGAFDLLDREVVRGVEVVRARTSFRRQLDAANTLWMATFMLSGIRAGTQLVRNREFDVINTHFALPTGPVGASLSRQKHLPNVLSVHGGDLYDPSKWLSPHRHAILRSVIRRLVRSADAVACQSQDTKRNLQRYFDRSAEPRLIPLGIPKPPAATAGREELALAADEFVIITIGRLVARKATDQLIRLVSRAANEKLRLLIVGDGPRADSLKRLAGELGVSSQITFTGFVSEQRKIDLLAAADIYASTSQHEGFGLVYLEAMAHGLPIVCYDRGGQTDFLENGINGAVLPLNDLDGFMAAVHELVTDTGKRDAISARNKAAVESFFIESCAQRYEALFREVIARHA